MSGSRCKELKRQFRAANGGMSPRGAVKEMVQRTGFVFGKRVSWLQMLVVVPSEWRRLKKATVV